MSKTVSGTTSQFVWDLHSPLPLLIKDGSAAYIYGPGGQPLEQINGSTALWLQHDQLGSTRLVTDSGGSVVSTYTYDPYGNLSTGTGTIANPLRFAGQYQDTESGLYYLRARYYDSATGQFLSRDPLTSVARGTYAYVSGNPVNLTDANGECPFCILAAVAVGALAGAVVAGYTAASTGGDIKAGIIAGAVGGAVGTAVGLGTAFVGAPEASLMMGGMSGGAVGGALYTAISEADAGKRLNFDDIGHGAVEGGVVGLMGGMIATGAGEFLGPATVGIFGAGIAGGILEPAAEMPLDFALSWGYQKLDSWGRQPCSH